MPPVPPPVLSVIRAKILELIGGMLKDDGYWYDWAVVNPSFFSVSNGGQIPEIVAMVEDTEESNLDQIGAVNAGLYINDVEFLITFAPRPEPPEGEPWVDHCDLAIDKGVEDLKRLFGNNPCLEGTAFVAIYTGSRKLYSGQDDLPAWCEFKLRVRYRQDRRQPQIPN